MTTSLDNFAYTYKDIYTGFTVSYNANQNIFAASSIKAPTDIYVYEMASLGKINLDDALTYTANYYNNGSGVLKSKPVNTNYTIRTLLEYSTVTSDNAAHNMLMDAYGRENMLRFWQEKGTTAYLPRQTIGEELMLMLLPYTWKNYINFMPAMMNTGTL